MTAAVIALPLVLADCGQHLAGVAGNARRAGCPRKIATGRWPPKMKTRRHAQIPVIEEHIRTQQYQQAFDLLQKVEAVLPEDPRLPDLRTECSWELTILTDPPGATVSRKPPDDPRREVGAVGRDADQGPARGPRRLSLEV